MSDTIPAFVIEDLFSEHGLVYIDDDRIPSELKAIGWGSETWQKKVADEFSIVHVIYAPDADGESVCISDQRMSVVVSSIVTNGRTENRIEKVSVIPDTPSKELEYLVAAIQAKMPAAARVEAH